MGGWLVQGGGSVNYVVKGGAVPARGVLWGGDDYNFSVAAFLPAGGGWMWMRGGHV